MNTTSTHTPLFYRQIVQVDRKRHQQVSVEPVRDLRFAAVTNSVLLLAAELGKGCREYPIVFVAAQGRYAPVAILGLRDGQNLFVDAAGRWQASYVPAYVRRYPFIPAAKPGSDGAVVCIDESYSGLNSDGRGEPLFLADGAVGPALQRSIGFLQEFQAQHRLTEAFCAELDRLNLFEPMRADIALPGGKKMQLNGFHVLNRQRLADVDDAAVVRLYRQGYLELIHAHCISLENFGRLVALMEGNTVK